MILTMRELYLIRHGIAAERGTYANDDERPLINTGRKKTEKVARRLYQIGVRFDRILTSPLVRAKQTADILQEAGLSSQIEEFTALAPDGDLSTWLEWLSEQSYQTLALVGHQPDLGHWAEMLVWGSIQEKLVVKKAGAIVLRLPESGTPVGRSELFLLTSPKWLI
jgi:phosphohistidine phosphatase